MTKLKTDWVEKKKPRDVFWKTLEKKRQFSGLQKP